MEYETWHSNKRKLSNDQAEITILNGVLDTLGQMVAKLKE